MHNHEVVLIGKLWPLLGALVGNDAFQQIWGIVSRLQADPYFVPSASEFQETDFIWDVEENAARRIVLLQHVHDWNGLQIIWKFGYSSETPSTPEKVFVKLHSRPFVDIPPSPELLLEVPPWQI
jgi:hypothetical protein